MGTAAGPLEREKRTVEAMVRVYCRGLHRRSDALCPDCEGLLAYAVARLDRCTFGAGKPKCADCPVHCYKPAMRDEIRKVMRYSGPRMAVRHPVLALRHAVQGALRSPVRAKR